VSFLLYDGSWEGYFTLLWEANCFVGKPVLSNLFGGHLVIYSSLHHAMDFNELKLKYDL
jgi:hypothetical protein